MPDSRQRPARSLAPSAGQIPAGDTDQSERGPPGRRPTHQETVAGYVGGSPTPPPHLTQVESGPGTKRSPQLLVLHTRHSPGARHRSLGGLACSHTRTHTRSVTCTHSHTHTHALTLMHTCSHSHLCTRTARSHMHSLSRTHLLTHMHSCSHSLTHTHTCTHMLARSRSHTHAHARSSSRPLRTHSLSCSCPAGGASQAGTRPCTGAEPFHLVGCSQTGSRPTCPWPALTLASVIQFTPPNALWTHFIR